jgi:hypothetical protein
LRELDSLGDTNDHDRLVIAKCDLSSNDVPVKIDRVPMISLFKAGSNEAIPYYSDRTMQGFQRFLVDQAVHGKEFKFKGSSKQRTQQQNNQSEHVEL